MTIRGQGKAGFAQLQQNGSDCGSMSARMRLENRVSTLQAARPGRPHRRNRISLSYRRSEYDISLETALSSPINGGSCKLRMAWASSGTRSRQATNLGLSTLLRRSPWVLCPSSEPGDSFASVVNGNVRFINSPTVTKPFHGLHRLSSMIQCDYFCWNSLILTILFSIALSV